MLRGTYRDPGGGRITLRQYAETVFMPAQSFDPITRERAEATLRNHIYPGLGAKRLQELEAHPSAVQGWVNGLPLAPASAARAFGLLSTIMNGPPGTSSSPPTRAARGATASRCPGTRSGKSSRGRRMSWRRCARVSRPGGRRSPTPGPARAGARASCSPWRWRTPTSCAGSYTSGCR